MLTNSYKADTSEFTNCQFGLVESGGRRFGAKGELLLLRVPGTAGPSLLVSRSDSAPVAGIGN